MLSPNLLPIQVVLVLIETWIPFRADGTPYEGGVFRMRLVLGHDFPHSPPKGKFSFIRLSQFANQKPFLVFLLCLA